jgi:pimeloyl-ACP methyl ester carboxylesterase
MHSAPARSLWRKGAALVAAAAVAAAAFLPLQAASGDSPTAVRASDGTKPTIVLVHGSYADSSSWAGVTAILQNQGYPVLIPAIPLRGVAFDTANLVAFLQQKTTGPLVLVGHSYGGVLITNAGLSDPDVQALVYVDGFAPVEGETAGELLGASDSVLNVPDPNTILDFVVYPGAPEGDADAYLQEDFFNEYFAFDVPPAIRAVLAAGQRPASGLTGSEPSGPPAWETVPSWFAVAALDRVIPAELQRMMAERAGSDVTEIQGSHLMMVSRPLSVAKVIQEAARSTQ